MHDSKEDFINRYRDNSIIYEELGKKIITIIEEIVKAKGVLIHGISYRTKDITSIERKIQDPKYTDPVNQITDFTGIRIVTYIENDLKIISEIIEEIFDIDEENSIDKSESLGFDRVGYKSIHYIAKLPKSRTKLLEYKKFANLSFEIQIRTILQHAWAEIEHKNYKFSGSLPAKLKRRFSILAGVLELADSEFNQLSEEIDKYSRQVEKNTKKGNFDDTINSVSIKSFMQEKFKSLGIKNFFAGSQHELAVLQELNDFGITTLKQLDDIIPTDFVEMTKKYGTTNNFGGLLRDIMIINDSEKYFNECRKKNRTFFNHSSFNLLKYYVKNIGEILQSYSIQVGQ